MSNGSAAPDIPEAIGLEITNVEVWMSQHLGNPGAIVDFQAARISDVHSLALCRRIGSCETYNDLYCDAAAWVWSVSHDFKFTKLSKFYLANRNGNHV